MWGQTAKIITLLLVLFHISLGGKDYGDNGSMELTLGDILTGYNYFSNKDEIEVDYLIMGPGLTNESDSQVKSQLLDFYCRR